MQSPCISKILSSGITIIFHIKACAKKDAMQNLAAIFKIYAVLSRRLVLFSPRMAHHVLSFSPTSVDG